MIIQKNTLNCDDAMDEWIICKICSEILDEPRMLTCQHTYCHRCLVSWVRDRKVLVCPECRFEMVLDEDGCRSSDDKIRHSIPINRMVNTYLENELKKSERCLKHDGSEFIYFCSSHRKLACSECILKECKRCHEKGCIKTVKDFAARPKFQSEVLEQKKELARKEENINKMMNRLADNGHQMEIDREEIEQKMELFTRKAEEMINSFKRNSNETRNRG